MQCRDHLHISKDLPLSGNCLQDVYLAAWPAPEKTSPSHVPLPPAKLPVAALCLSKTLVCCQGTSLIASMMQDGFQQMIPYFPQPKSEVTQSYRCWSDISKALWVNVSTRLDFHLAIGTDAQKSSPWLHTTQSYLSWLEQHLPFTPSFAGGKKSTCYSIYGVAVLNSLLSHFTFQILWAGSRSHMVKAEQNMGFLFCGKSHVSILCFQPKLWWKVNVCYWT